MTLKKFWKMFRYHILFYIAGGVIVSAIAIIMGLEYWWVPVITFFLGSIPVFVTRLTEITDRQDAIDEYDPVTHGSIKVRYSAQSPPILRWCIHLEIGINDEYPIVPVSVDLYDEEKQSRVLDLTSSREKVALTAFSNERDKFFNKAIRGKFFSRIYLGFPNEKELPTVSGDLMLKFIYIIKSNKKERFYPVLLNKYKA